MLDHKLVVWHNWLGAWVDRDANNLFQDLQLELLELLLSESLLLSDHLDAILKQLAAISIHSHGLGVVPDLLEDELPLVIITVFKNGTKNKSSILILDEQVVLWEHLVNNWLDHILWAVVDHSLDDSAPILVLAEHNEILLNCWDELFKSKWRAVFTHIHEYLLNDMVAIEVHWAIQDVVVTVQLIQHIFSLLGGEHLECSLDDSATVFVGRKIQDVPFDIIEDDIMIFLIRWSVDLDSLNHVITVLILYKLLKIDSGIF